MDKKQLKKLIRSEFKDIFDTGLCRLLLSVKV